jgi:hypothetical protein
MRMNVMRRNDDAFTTNAGNQKYQFPAAGQEFIDICWQYHPKIFPLKI